MSAGGKKRKRIEPRIDTLSVHAGQGPDPAFGAVMPPIYATSTYAQKKLGGNLPYEYSRVSNPTRSALENCMTELEGGVGTVAFSSGMAAITALVHLLHTGDHVIVSRNVYGGVYRAFELLFRDMGLDFSWVDSTSPREIEKAVSSNTRLVYIETPTNPLMEISDIGAIAAVASKKKVLLAVDNTFMTPCFQNPLKLGADVVIHSTTKYLNGHSDSLGGTLTCSSRKVLDRLRFVAKTSGAVLSPFEAFLILRGIRTLSVRMNKHEENGRAVAEFLSRRKEVRKVFYPGLKRHPGKSLHEKQCRGYGGMVSFELESFTRARRFLENLRLFTLAESLGGVESLACHPATMTHASLPKDLRESLGVKDSLVRLSVGIENADDLIADISSALAQGC